MSIAGIEFNGLYVESDEAYEALETAFMNRELIQVQLAMPSGKLIQAKAGSLLSIAGPYDAEATVSGSLQEPER